MDNMLTYLKWRGDASFGRRPFGEVDNIVLSAVAYLDFDGIVPGNGGFVTLPDAWDAYRRRVENGMPAHKFAPVLAAMADSRRFCTAMFSHYRQLTDEEQQTQFAAVHILLEGGLTYIAFRGTDDTIVGWREDFALGSQIVPAQRMAADYLAATIQPGRRYIIGGHSKGGNLAVYGALQLPQTQLDRVLTVYNNDGPGLSADIVPAERYDRLAGKLVQFVPQFCLIGKLFPHGEPDKIVLSSAEGLLQHDIGSWQVEGDALAAVPEITSQLYVNIFDQWINSADMEQRRVFTRDFFDALEAGGARTVDQITGSGIDGFGTVLLSLAGSEPRTKIVIGKLIGSFVQNIRQIDLLEALRAREAYSGALLFALGLFCMQWPAATLTLLSAGLGAAGMGWCGYKLMQFAVRRNLTDSQKRLRVLVYLILFAGATSLFLNRRVALVSVHVVLGILLLATAVSNFRALTALPKTARGKRAWRGLVAAAALLMGVVAFTTGAELPTAYVFSLGVCLVVYGIVQTALGLYHNGERHRRRG
ncbi:MAG TPA: DUF2974 domain-containing protein [Candidatus Gemmiger faecigallinarum]|nr:DUF2974 domain-containing protein [Candidatus Gemmiger faecigallinarum]